ncbi:MFS transporter [Iodobacter sp. BJB302]|uniref:MFS transporter n=1 Tax=Iodobacter sp. BJB302 TaxID=1506510 RepID=UPI0035B560E6
MLILKLYPPNPAVMQNAASARWVLASLSLAILLPSLSTSIANVGLPALAQAFNATFQQVQWVVIAYLLAMTTLIVSVGRLGELAGRRRLLMTGILLFTLASILCAIAPTLNWLIAARAVQGLGAAMMMSLTMAFVGEVIPKEKTGSAMGLLGSMSAVGTALGPSLGGVLIAGPGWQAIFLINIPPGILAFLLAQRHLPLDRPAARRPRFDHLGTLLLAFTLAAYALAMTMGRGHFGLLNVALLLAAACGTGLFIVAEKSAAAPLIRLDLLRNVALNTGLATSALVATVIMATLVVGPFYLSRAFGLDATHVGLLMSIGPIAAALTGVPAGKITDHLGTLPSTLIGLSSMAAGCFALALLPASLGGYISPMVLITSGYALFQTANNTAVMGGISKGQRGLISGLLNLSRNLGLITGASLMGAVFVMAAGTNTFSSASPEAVTHGLNITFVLAAGLILLAIVMAIKAYRIQPVKPMLSRRA